MDKFMKLSADFKKGLDEAFAKKEVQELFASIKAADVSKLGTFRVKITNEAIDRAGEMIKADGWDFGPYMKSPVVLWGHDYKGLPVGMTLRLVQEGVDTIAEGVFAPTDFAQECRKLYEMGMLRASSVGFIPKEMEGNIITKAELLEWSFVAVPCNAEALSMLSANPSAYMTQDEVRNYADSLITKGFMFKEAEKGAVEDEIMATNNYEAKCEYLEDVYEVLNAFFDLAYSEETTLDMLPSLLTETGTLLGSIAAGTYVSPEDAMEGEKTVLGSIKKLDKTAIEKFMQDIKNNKKPSELLKSDISLALTSMKTLGVALEGLLSKEASLERKALDADAEVKEGQDFLFMRSIMQEVASATADGLAEARKRAVKRNII